MKSSMLTSLVKNLGLLPYFLLLSCYVGAQPQNDPKTRHIIALQTGLNQIKEENLHPKVSTGIITQLSYGFEKQGSSLQEFHFTVGYSRMKTSIEELSKTVNLRLNSAYSQSYSLLQKETFHYYLGPEITAAYSAAFFPNWDDSHLYWADHFSVGLRNVLELQLKNKNRWLSSVSFPVFSVFSRPAPERLYKIDDVDFSGIVSNLHSNLSAGTWNKCFYLIFQTEYRFPIFRNNWEALVYSLDFLKIKHSDANPVTQLLHQIGLRIYL